MTSHKQLPGSDETAVQIGSIRSISQPGFDCQADRLVNRPGVKGSDRVPQRPALGAGAAAGRRHTRLALRPGGGSGTCHWVDAGFEMPLFVPALATAIIVISENGI